VTWLGYLATTGLPTMDYRLTDARADPIGVTDALHTETLWRLPETMWCYAPHTGAPAVGPLPALANGCITFGSLNNPAKVSRTIADLWGRILEATPDSTLVLIESALEAGMARLRERFSILGIDPRRIEFMPRQSTADYLALYNRIDVALDTWPCAGGTTTCDALWMGAPVVTLAAERSFSRSGASVLYAVGLPELVTEAADAYVECATALARDLPRLAALRASLRSSLLRSPLLDARRFAAGLEEAYLAMAERALAGASS
jgi:protein O-GlcNAc transferase